MNGKIQEFFTLWIAVTLIFVKQSAANRTINLRINCGIYAVNFILNLRINCGEYWKSGMKEVTLRIWQDMAPSYMSEKAGPGFT